jgi:hypothetical protein
VQKQRLWEEAEELEVNQLSDEQLEALEQEGFAAPEPEMLFPAVVDELH